MHPVKELDIQVRRWMEEMANTGDVCENRGSQASTAEAKNLLLWL